MIVFFIAVAADIAWECYRGMLAENKTMF
jgi:hypothetical protein